MHYHMLDLSGDVENHGASPSGFEISLGTGKCFIMHKNPYLIPILEKLQFDIYIGGSTISLTVSYFFYNKFFEYV